MTSGKHLRLLRPWLALGLMATAAAALSQTDSTTEPEAAGGMSAFGKMIPLGFENKNVSVPSFKNGKRASLLTASTITRLDENRLEAKEVVVEMYAEDPAENLRVDLHSAIYHMQDQVLRSGERSRVARTDFEMEGDSMVFDTAKSIGSMKGRVRTLIFEMDTGAGQAEDSPPSN